MDRTRKPRGRATRRGRVCISFALCPRSTFPMRASETLIPTLKETPAEAEIPSHVLLLRSGCIRQLASGLYTWLPLGLRVLRKVEAIIREELDRRGAREVQMPVVQPAELWRESGRWDVMGPELLRMRDRHERDYAMSPTHEEVVTDLVRRVIDSYHDVPLNLYQIQTKFRDEIRPRFGVLRAREFLMKDGYSFHLTDESFERTYRDMHDAYTAILERIGLAFRAVEADSGNIGDSESHEFQVLGESGEDLIAYCPDSDYAANVEKARALPPKRETSVAEPIERVATPGCHTIAEVADFLGVAETRCVKTLIVRGAEVPLVALVLRGDHQLNETKAGRLPAVASPVAFASDAEIEAAVGCSVGSIGPVNLALPVHADASAAALANFVCGANEDGVHLTGANWGRDATADVVDLRNVVAGDPSPDGKGVLEFARGIEVGHIFKLGTKYSDAMQLALQDGSGDEVSLVMGCYGMGVSRLVAAIVEQCHDAAGIAWPAAVAPFDLHVLALDYGRSEDVRRVADGIHDAASAAGRDVLLDDRDERPGVKFADADLIGIPERVTVGARGLRDGVVEFRRRGGGETTRVPVEDALRGEFV